jgi:outer membrane receptor protein involved in Fe transport
VVKRLLCGVAMLWPVAASPAVAQAQPAPEPQEIPPAALPAEKPRPETPAIIITGSRIPLRNLTAVSPVTVVQQQEIKLEGVTMTEELLNQLPQVQPDQGAFISNGATGTSTVVLRGLGAGRTLVLINGRRFGPGDPDYPAPDLNMIPSSLIGRVEVLTGGASSVYGSDAVSGVINFILDQKLNGLRVDGQASFFQHYNNSRSGILGLLENAGIGFPRGSSADGGRQDINAAFGTGLFDGRAHVTVYAGYRPNAQLTQDQRDYSACTINADPFDDGNLDELGCGGSPVGYPGNFRALGLNQVFQIGPDRTFFPGRSSFNFAPFNFYQRPDRRYTAGGFANYEIADAFKPYAEAMWMDDRSLAQIAPSGDFGNTNNINCDNPLLSDQQRSLVCVNGNFVGQQTVFDEDGNIVQIRGSPRPFIDPVTGATYYRARLSIRRRALESGGRQEDLRHKDLRLVGGFKGDLSRGISYDASYVYGRAKKTTAHLNDFSIPRLVRALDVIADPATGRPVCRSVLTHEDADCVPWDVFALGGVTPEATAYLSVPSFRAGATKEQIANFNITFDVGEWGVRSPWADEAPALNAGAEYRKDRLDNVPDELAQSGDLAGAGIADPPVHGSTAVKELFAEARIPLLTGRLIERLALEAGYRQSWYGAGGNKTSTNAYKVALDLAPVRGLRLRASQQRAVRAPNITELFTPFVADQFSDDPCAGPTPDATPAQCANAGVAPGQYGQIIKLPPGAFQGYNSIVGGNVELQPETAMTRTIGVVLEPQFLRGFNATVDWWDIDLQGAIEQIGADSIMTTCIVTADPSFCTRIHRDAEGSLWLSPEGYVDNRLANIGGFKLRGVDIGVNYTRGLGRFGSASLGFLATWVTKWTVDNGGLSTAFDCAGLYGFWCGNPTPSWRHKARLTWESRSGVALSLGWRRTGRMEIADASGQFDDTPFHDFSKNDRFLRPANYFDLSALFKVNRDYAFRLGVNNMLDREPQLVTGNLGACWGGCNGNTFPQWYDPLGRFFFAGITANLKPF